MAERTRLERLRAQAAKPEFLLLSHLPDVRYMTGFTGSNAVLLVLPHRAVLFTDGRYTDQAAEECARSGVRVVIGKKLLEQACALLLRSGATSARFDPGHTTVAALERMRAALPESLGKAARNRFFQPLDASPVAALREQKEEQELRVMEEAALLGCRMFDAILPRLVPGTPERAIAAELEYSARQMGAEGMAFETIVASGKRSAMPHGHATEQGLPKRGFVTLDFGVMLRGYCSDMTRTVYLGRPTREERAAYAAVLEAEQAGMAAVRSGIAASKVDAAARGTLRRHGLDKYFSHSTGHGLGLEIHEGPRLGAKVKQKLTEGMVVTIEPGVYLPGQFGIRIEDTVVVEKQGARVLTPAPRELLTL